MNAVAVYEFRHSCDVSIDQVRDSLKQFCKKWCFQKEKGDTGYEHYQGHFSLIKKRRKTELLKVLPIKFMHMEPLHETEDEHLYSLKADTRIEGPWSDKDVELYIPRQYRGLLEKLYPWQQQIWDNQNACTRNINVLYCPVGKAGKSTIASLMDLYGKALDLPPINDMQDLIALMCDMCIAMQKRDVGTVFMDMPRAMKKDTLYGVYSAIEQIKKGKLYDIRYHYKYWWIDSPEVWVFTNLKPDDSLLSRDRWDIWVLDETKNLQKYVSEPDLFSEL